MDALFKVSEISGIVPGKRVARSPKHFGCPKLVPWDTNPWDY